MLTTFERYRLTSQNLARSLARIESEPRVAQEVHYYRKNIGNVKSVDDFLGDRRLFRFAMKAHGIEDMSYAKALMGKVLNEGIDSNTALANRLSDNRYREFAETFNFARYGEAATTFTAAQQGTVDKYIRQSLENSAGADSQGLRLALYFERKASEIRGPFDILADAALAEVIGVGLGISKTMAKGSIDAQAAMIIKRYDLTKLQDPAEVQRFLQKFTAMWDTQNSSTWLSTSSPATLITSGYAAGISIDLLLGLQQIKLGRR